MRYILEQVWMNAFWRPVAILCSFMIHPLETLIPFILMHCYLWWCCSIEIIILTIDYWPHLVWLDLFIVLLLLLPLFICYIHSVFYWWPVDDGGRKWKCTVHDGSDWLEVLFPVADVLMIDDTVFDGNLVRRGRRCHLCDIVDSLWWHSTLLFSIPHSDDDDHYYSVIEQYGASAVRAMGSTWSVLSTTATSVLFILLWCCWYIDILGGSGTY
jgi:hypothetical protein